MDWRGLEQWRSLDGARVRIPTLLLEAYHDPLAHDDVHQTLLLTVGAVSRPRIQPVTDKMPSLEVPYANQFPTLYRLFDAPLGVQEKHP